jgi:signal transduction histidine kinase
MKPKEVFFSIRVNKDILKISVRFDSQMIGITVIAVVFVIIVTVACFIFILRRRRRKAGELKIQFNCFNLSLE